MTKLHGELSSDRPLYLHDIALEQAIAAWDDALAAAGLLEPLAKETIALQDGLGRITAEPVWALTSSPHYHAAAMDGFAVLAEETQGASETRPLRLLVGEQAIPVDTGDPMPPHTNAVVMIEAVQRLRHDDVEWIEIIEPTVPWHHVRAMGEDMVASELVLPVNHRLRPQDLGAMAGCGHLLVSVYRRPRIAIIPTGSELVPIGKVPLEPGDIIEYNSLVLGALAEEAGCIVTRYAIHADVRAEILATVEEALQRHDLVIINAGSSAGTEDFTASIVRELGTLVVHGIAIRPGHPVILGVARGKALAGLPGYPVSAAMTFDLLVKPLLHRWQGQRSPSRDVMQASLTRKTVSSMGEDDFVRVTLGKVGDRVMATPLAGGAGVISSLVKADALLRIPRYSEGHHAGETVQVELFSQRDKVERTISIIGSHDMTLDVMADYLRRGNADVWLSSAHVGSVGGLLALQRGEAHLAGSHLLDEETGEYNLGSIRKLLTPHGVEVVVLGFVKRVQGLMVPPGNPKRILGLEDLARSDVQFVNRQRGAGTRVLLDFKLRQAGVEPRSIRGYGRQEFTHLGVAAAVASGAADTGLGILSAARALDLDFVPLFSEQYDLIVPRVYYEGALLQPLLDLLRDRSSGLVASVEAMGGYETGQMGEVLATV